MIRDIFLQASYKLWFVYTILVVEYILYSSMPWLLGKSIDSLLLSNYSYFIMYGLCGIVGLFVGVFRRQLDTRIFSHIALNMTEKFLKKMFESNLCSSKIIVRIKKINVFTSFAEYTIPSVVRSTIYICVSFVCLFSTIGLWTLFLFGIMLLTLITSYFFSLKLEKCIEEVQLIDEQKEKFTIERNVNKTIKQCRLATTSNIKFSDIQASNWGVVDLCCLFCELVAILILTLVKNSSVGQIMSSLMYVQSLCGYFQVFPSIIEQLKHLKIASKYLKQEC